MNKNKVKVGTRLKWYDFNTGRVRYGVTARVGLDTPPDMIDTLDELGRPWQVPVGCCDLLN